MELDVDGVMLTLILSFKLMELEYELYHRNLVNGCYAIDYASYDRHLRYF